MNNDKQINHEINFKELVSKAIELFDYSNNGFEKVSINNKKIYDKLQNRVFCSMKKMSQNENGEWGVKTDNAGFIKCYKIFNFKFNWANYNYYICEESEIEKVNSTIDYFRDIWPVWISKEEFEDERELDAEFRNLKECKINWLGFQKLIEEMLKAWKND